MIPHARVVKALEGVRAEVFELGLLQVGRQTRAAVAVEEGERRREGGRGRTFTLIADKQRLLTLWCRDVYKSRVR